MNHTPETLKAADDYIGQFQSDTPPDPNESFLAGYEHKQKEIDELVEALESTLPILESNGYAIKANSHRKLIQKHKR